MLRFLLMLTVAGGLSGLCTAQKLPLQVGFHGFAGVSAFSDSRSSATTRNGHIYLYPHGRNLSQNGEDLNKRGELNIDAAHSRLGLDLTGPGFKDIQTTAMIEGDFLGKGSGDSNVRLRHAYLRFTGERWSLLAGQTWHPLFIPENCPGTIGSNAGAPFHPLNRSPQIQFTWQASPGIQLLLFLIEQNNFRSAGFPKGSEESMVPEFDIQIKWQNKSAWAALTAGLNSLAIPESIEPSGTPVKVKGFHYNASLRYRLPAFTVSMEGIYGGNLSGMAMPGGVGKTVGGEYKPLHTGSLWMGLQSNRMQGWQPGLFMGWLHNTGAGTPVTVVEELSRDPKIAVIYGLSPRLKYIFGNVWAGAEWLWTTAEWGDSFDAYGVPENTLPFENHRFLLSLRYNF